MTATARPELEGLERYRFGWADSYVPGARANLAGCRPSRPVPLNAHAGLSAEQLPAHPAARVLDDLRQGSRRSRRLVYGVLHGPVLPVWRGMGSRPRRALSRLGGATVVTGGDKSGVRACESSVCRVAYFRVADAVKSIVAIENADGAINRSHGRATGPAP